MARSIVQCAARVFVVMAATAWLTECGGSGGQQRPNTSTPASDAGAELDAASGTADSSVADVAEAFGDGGVSCIEGGAGPKGTLLVQSSTASLLGLTDDDRVIYVDGSSSTLFAVPAAGGSPVSLGRSENSVTLAGTVVFNWTGVNQDGTIANALEVWTSYLGAHSLASASLVGAVDSSADGSKLLYFDNASGSKADLYVASSDGSGKVKLATGVPFTQSCMPQVSFVGRSVALGYCTSAPSGSATPVGSLVLYVGASGTGTTLSTSAFLSFQSTDTSLIYETSSGLMAADLTTGAAHVIDADCRSSALTHDGQSAVYVTSNGAIKRSSIVSPNPTTLVAADGFIDLSTPSPDDQWLLASKTRDLNTGNIDIYVASATAPGAAVAVLQSATGTYYGSAFTADSSRVLYIDNAIRGAGDYHVARTTGGPGNTIATRTWLGLATTGAKVVYQDAFVPNVGLGGQGIADIESIDLSAPSPASVLLVQQADPGFYFTSTGDRLVYSMTYCADGSQGIWVMATP